MERKILSAAIASREAFHKISYAIDVQTDLTDMAREIWKTIDEYYEIMGWDKDGNPPDET